MAATITLNQLDDDGNIVDTDHMELSEEALSDIVDQAANVILARRDGKTKQVEYFLNELAEALASYNVIDSE